MQKIKNRIAILKRKLLIKEVISLLGLDEYSEKIRYIEDDDITLNNLKNLYKFSEKHLINSFNRDNLKVNNILQLTDNVNWDKKDITFFVFFKERTQIILSMDIFLKKRDSITMALFNLDDDIIFYNEDFKCGFCFLYDEYNVSFYKWGKEKAQQLNYI